MTWAVVATAANVSGGVVRAVPREGDGRDGCGEREEDAERGCELVELHVEHLLGRGKVASETRRRGVRPAMGPWSYDRQFDLRSVRTAVAEQDDTQRTRVRRHPERGVYDRAAIAAILDEALFCHVGFVEDGRPFVIPTIQARRGDVLYLHGSPASRMLRTVEGVDVCVTVTLLDGIVLARSVYNHSMNYRSAVVLGRARKVIDRSEKLAALEAIVEHVVPGRSTDARAPSEKELAATVVLSVPLEEASAKIRSGPPSDFDDDLELRVWAGVLPLRLTNDAAEADPALPDGVSLPAYLDGYRRDA
jgi:nitroimidazol reductase NimA-like FMN-containing flavoprotein (pyridoxamine 5'-phosphate oxidase superfamily)